MDIQKQKKSVFEMRKYVYTYTIIYYMENDNENDIEIMKIKERKIEELIINLIDETKMLEEKISVCKEKNKCLESKMTQIESNLRKVLKKYWILKFR